PPKVYHINSLRRAHSSAYAFDVTKWFLSNLHEKVFDAFEWKTFVFNTKPQQSNSVDCGLYLLHYMDVISKHVAAAEPQSIEDKLGEWISTDFNATKAASYRSKLHSRVA
ncbi:hypothetical protein PHYSODRAFT_410593, partial [Phytophthora sojae]